MMLAQSKYIIIDKHNDVDSKYICLYIKIILHLHICLYIKIIIHLHIYTYMLIQ